MTDVRGNINQVVSHDDAKKVAESISVTYSKVLPTHNIWVPSDFDSSDYSVYNGDYASFYVHNSLNTTDKYTQCAECGLYIPVGEVTNSLPDNLICHGHNDSAGSYIDDDYLHYTYDEVLYTVEHNGVIPESFFNRYCQHHGFNSTTYDYFVEHQTYAPEDLAKLFNYSVSDTGVNNDPLTELIDNIRAHQEPIILDRIDAENIGVITNSNVSVY